MGRLRLDWSRIDLINVDVSRKEVLSNGRLQGPLYLTPCAKLGHVCSERRQFGVLRRPGLERPGVPDVSHGTRKVLTRPTVHTGRRTLRGRGTWGTRGPRKVVGGTEETPPVRRPVCGEGYTKCAVGTGRTRVGPLRFSS